MKKKEQDQQYIYIIGKNRNKIFKIIYSVVTHHRGHVFLLYRRHEV